MSDEQRSSADFLDASWEAKARAALEAAGQDPDLGVSAARDALRLVAGEITEHEFHSRHHEAYLREFGVDSRPLEVVAGDARSGVDGGETGGGGTGAPGEADSVDGERLAVLSRRDALRLASAGAAVLFFGTTFMRSRVWAGSSGGTGGVDAAPQQEGEVAEGRAVRWGMVIDLENCTGCLACVDGCHTENGLSDGVHWIYSLPFTDENRDGVNFLIRPCMHCSNAPCVKVCPVTARHVREQDGLVLTDYDLCIGCRYCEVSCPYGVNYFQWAEPSTYGGSFSGERRDIRGRAVIGDSPRGTMSKCTFCPQRIDDERRGTAACALACPHDVIFVGDLNDPESAPRLHLEHRRRENPNLSTFRLLDELGTQPNIIYIGQEPTRRAEQAENPPTRYEDWGFIEDRRAVLEGPDAWFQRIVRRS